MNNNNKVNTGGTNEQPPENKEMEHCRHRIEEMERHIRNMRLAIIVIVAFFIYDTLAPDGFRDRTHTLTRIETRELRVVDERGRALIRMNAHEAGGALRIDGTGGARLTIEPEALVMRPVAGTAVPRMALSPTGVKVYGE